MANESLYLIEILLQARDQTSSAVAKAIANLTGLEVAERKAGREAEQMSAKFNRAFKDFDEHSVALKNTSEELKRLGASSQEALKAEEALDKATRAHQRSLNEYGETSRKTQLALHDVAEAQERVTKAQGEAIAEQVRLNAAVEESTKIREENLEKRLTDEAKYQERLRQMQERADAEEEERWAAKEQRAQRQTENDAKRAEQRLSEEEQLQAHLKELDDRAETEEEERWARDAARRAQTAESKERDRLADEKAETELAALREHLGQQEAEQEKSRYAERVANWEHQQDQARQQAEDDVRYDRERTAREREYQSLLRGATGAQRQADIGRAHGVEPEIQQRLDLNVADFEAKLAIVVAQIRELDGKDIDVKLDLNAAKFLAEAGASKVAMRDIQKDAKETNSLFGILRNSVSNVGDSFDGSSQRIAAFDNLLRGLMTLGITVFLQQLVQIGGALVGMLGALVASAVQAGAALGGALVAGLTQALPVAGVLATALSRVKNVMNAVKQENLLDQQESYKAAAAQDKQAKSLDGVQRAQEALTKARRDAVRQIQDLILAERAAQLAAEGAALSQEDAQRALQAAIAGGGDVARAQLNVKQADLGVDQADQGLVKATRARREGADPENTDAVKSAKAALKSAQDSAQATTDSVSAAKGKLDYLLSQMSASEVALYKAMIRLQTRFRDFGKDISAPIIDQFTFAVNRITRLLGDDKIKSAARSLSTGIAGTLGGIFRSFTGKGTIDQFIGFAKEAQKNLKPIESIVENVGHAFLNLGDLGKGALRGLLDSLKDVAHNFREFTESKSGQDSIKKFLSEGLTALRQWGGLLFNIARLFLAISGAGGAQTGTKAVEDFSKAVGRAADEINTKGSKARQFFEDFFATSRKVVDALKPIWESLAHQFVLTFGDNTTKSVQGFASMLADVIIPAIGEFIRKIGEGTTAIGDFVKDHPGFAKMASSFLGILLVATALSKLSVFFQPVIGVFKILGSVAEGVWKKFGLGEKAVLQFRYLAVRIAEVVAKIGPLSAALDGVAGVVEGLGVAIAGIGAGPIAIIVAVIAVFILLLAKFGLLDDAIDAVKGGFNAFWKEVEPPLGRLVDSFQNLWKKIKEGGGVFAVLRGVGNDVLKPIMKVLVDIGAIVLKVFGHGFGQVIGGFIDIISGAINVVVDLLSGDWKGAWEGAKQLVMGLVHVLEGAFLTLPSLMLKLGKAVVDGLIDGLKSLGQTLLDLFLGAFDGILRWLGIASPSTRARSWGKAIVDGFVNGLRAISRAVVAPFRAAADAIWNAIKAVASFGRKIADLWLDGMRRAIRGWTNIGSWIWNTINDAVGGIGDKLKDVGKNIIGKLVEGLKAARGIFRDALRGIIKELPGGETILKAIDKVDSTVGSVIDKAANAFAAGGPVPGSGSGDVVRALLTPGEHVWTKGEVQAAGGHAAMFALRRLLGGGLQGGPFAFATGGVVVDPRTGLAHGGSFGSSYGEGFTAADMKTQSALARAQRQQDLDDQKQAAAKARAQRVQDLTTEREDYKHSSDQRAVDWGVMWNDILTTTRRATNDVQTQVREMRVGVTNTLTRLNRDTGDLMTRMVRNFSDGFGTLSQAAYDGLNYIGHETNRALKALSAKTLDFGLSPPPSTAGGVPTSDRFSGGHLASGGFVGQPGERGRDGVQTWLGRGEAVLNWGHQKLVNSALWNTYGTTLPQMFRTNFGYHAGGPGSAPGHALGGGDLFDGHPSNVNSAVKALIELMKKNFPLVVGSTTDHSLMTTSGNVSDHVGGNAVDLGGSIPVMLKAAQWVKSSGLYKKLKQAIHNPNLAVNAGQLQDPPGQFAGAVWAQHANHIHLAIVGALKGAYESAVGAGTDQIGKLTVRGAGALKDVAQSAIDAVRKIANKAISKSGFDTDADTDDSVSIGQGAKGKEIFRYFKQRGFSDEQAAAWVGNFVQESGLNPAIVQPNGEGHGLAQWGGGRFAALQEFAAARHTQWQDLQTQLDFVWHELTGSERAAYSSIKAAKSLNDAVNAVGVKYERYGIQGDRSGPAREALKAYAGEFATGGQVPGGPGQPVLITAHAGEWVLNAVQQSKLAQFIGTGVGRLRDALGFTGGPGSYAGGGTVKGDKAIDFGDIPVTTITGYESRIRRIAEAIKKLNEITKPGKGIDALVADVDKLTNETSGYFAFLNTAIEARAQNVTNGIALLQQGLQRVGTRLKRIAPETNASTIGLRELANLVKTGDDYDKARSNAARDLAKVNESIAALRKGGVSDKEMSAYQSLIGQRQDFQKALDDYDSKIVQNRSDRFAKQQEIFQAGLDNSLKANTRATAANDSSKRIGDIFGLDTSAQSNAARDLAKEREATLRERLAEATRRAKTDPRWQETVDSLTDQVNTAAETTAQATHDAISAGIDAITKKYDDRATARDITTRLATLTGNQDVIAANLATGIGDLTSSIVDYQGQAIAAHQAGDLGLEKQLKAKIDDLGAQVQEKTAEMIQQAADAADTAFQNSEARRAITGRAADLLERIGDKPGAIAKREGISESRLTDLRKEQTSIGAQYAAAQAAGLTVLADSLKTKFDDLGESIDEEIQTRKDLTYQYRQAQLDIITGKTSRSTGLIGSAQDLLTRIGVNAGTAFDPRALIEKAGQELAKAVPGIANQVLSGSGEFGGQAGGVLESLRSAFLAGPGDFASKLADLGPTIADLESTMGDAQKTTFAALIQAMLDNTSQTVDNTKSLKDATGALSGPQSFASSSWSWFRNAIFSGMGDVLPQYQIPHMQGGGHITKGGVFELHPGEFVANADRSNVADGDINITMNSVNGDVDLTALAARIAFAKKSRG